jgi:ABC-type multidrug transport system permease subunit
MFAYEIGSYYINMRNIAIKPSNYYLPTRIAMAFLTSAMYFIPVLFYLSHPENEYENAFSYYKEDAIKKYLILLYVASSIY